MKKILIILLLITTFSFSDGGSLSGTWEYIGGVYNGKKRNSSPEYTLERMYIDETHFITYALYTLKTDFKPKIYETGNYSVKADTCIETQTYSMQSTKLNNIAVHYQFTIRNDSLILKGFLPPGMVVEEYWKRVPPAPPPL